jgi:uncharacterized protein (TIGR02147 family)
MHIKSSFFLKQCFERFLEKSPSGSMRQFAQVLEIAPGRLSQYLNGKRDITAQMAEKISDKLFLKKEQRNNFIALVNEEAEFRREQKNGRLPAVKGKSDQDYYVLSPNDIDLMSSWYYFPLLSIFNRDDFKSDSKWIANQLGTTTREIESALSTLLRIGIIKESNGVLKRSYDRLRTTSELPVEALRRSHRETILKAMESLDNVPVSLRDVTSITMAIDPKNLIKAKKMIAKFRRELCLLLENGKKTDVYNLNIQLVPGKGA